jgi:hypothetical protein
MTKCQICKKSTVAWAWQPFGPDSYIQRCTTLGSHYRGFPVIKICDNCRDSMMVYGGINFNYKNKPYHASVVDVQEGYVHYLPKLWEAFS